MDSHLWSSCRGQAGQRWPACLSADLLLGALTVLLSPCVGRPPARALTCVHTKLPRAYLSAAFESLLPKSLQFVSPQVSSGHSMQADQAISALFVPVCPVLASFPVLHCWQLPMRM